MNKIIASLTCLMFVAVLGLAQDAAAPAAAPAAAAPDAVAPAAPAMMPLELRKTGIISVTKDASGKVTAIKLIATSYDIQLDEGSKPLEAMDGQKVRINCTLSHEGGKRILTVKSVEPSAEAGAGAAAVPTVVTPAGAPAAAPEKPAEAPAVE